MSTQTTVTAFALCARCSQTQETLISVASSVSVLCHEEGLESSLAKVDWEALAKIGGMELGKWNGNLKTDLCSIGEHCCRLKEAIAELELERDAHKRTVGQLEREIQQLSNQMDTLQVTHLTQFQFVLTFEIDDHFQVSSSCNNHWLHCTVLLKCM